VSNTGGVGKQAILDLCADISKSPQLLLMNNRKLHIRFRLAPKSMTLDDLELLICYKFEFSENFA